MRINGNEIRPGMILEHNGKLYKAIKTQHVKPGKGPAYLQAELKGIQDGTKLHERFRSDQAVERVSLEQKECVFSYLDGNMYNFMEKETFEMITLSKSEINAEQIPYITEELEVTIEFYNDKPISIQLPPKVILEVIETQVVIKGQTATSSFKPAVLENGVKTTVPQHIEVGTKIIVNTEDNTYSAKS